jgi:hypothetical protein
VDQGGGLQGLTRGLARELVGGKLAQFLVEPRRPSRHSILIRFFDAFFAHGCLYVREWAFERDKQADKC